MVEVDERVVDERGRVWQTVEVDDKAARKRGETQVDFIRIDRDELGGLQAVGIGDRQRDGGNRRSR